jgi:hypothetical protein
MRRMVLLVTVVAVMAVMVAASAATALAQPKDTFTVTCKGFIIGQDEPFTQTLPENAREGSKKSIEQTNERSPEDKCKQSR